MIFNLDTQKTKYNKFISKNVEHTEITYDGITNAFQVHVTILKTLEIFEYAFIFII